MERTDNIHRIAFLGDYLPRQCGIATFTHSLYTAIKALHPDLECSVVAVNDLPEGYEHYPEEVHFEIPEQELKAYRQAANYLNFSNIDVVSLQHEFGIFGGPAGSHVLSLLRKLHMPVITTFHTILENPDPDQRFVMNELIALSARLVTMSQRGKQFLEEVYKAPAEKIDLIPHGIPDMPFLDPNYYKDQFNADGKYVFLTFGLLSANKGIEQVIQALPQVVAEYPDLVYIVLGATHPGVLRSEGETYRTSLQQMVAKLGLIRHVVFIDRFVGPEELEHFIVAADVYITPYRNRAQITSGTLSYSFGCGKAVVSTPYWHAEELLADDRGVLVPFDDHEGMAKALTGLLRDRARRHAIRKKAYLLGREMVWSNVAGLYLDSFEKARSGILPASSRVGPATGQKKELPALRLDHLLQLTDKTGLLQHGRFGVARYEYGYCTDDNARGLLLCVLLAAAGLDTQLINDPGRNYAAFLDYAFNTENKRFRNFMGFDRQWREELGSEDSHGRALWALGACVGRSSDRSLQIWAAQLFDQALPTMLELEHPRAWAFGMIGIHEYLRRFEGNRAARQILEALAQRFIDLYEQHASNDWQWPEDILSYDNAKLPHALLISSNEQAVELGLKSLRWLIGIQTAEAGHFRPIGSDGWYPRDGARRQFDQQPVEAYATISACLEAFHKTEDFEWLEAARNAFDWFLGANDLGLAMFDPATGACFDGLQVDRLNQNQGAESTLSFLLSITEMASVEKALNRSLQSTDAI